ncbi:hypothetical protein AGR7B_Lc50269 [Agrobacterium deltaense RV3]|nr:hypothetical protein AGR7B_Lc50269 [Agrobacterium deltaense RV3]
MALLKTSALRPWIIVFGLSQRMRRELRALWET